MKKLKTVLCLLLAACLLSGCSILDGEYTSVTRHVPGDMSLPAVVPVMRAASYDEIFEALEDMVKDGVESAVIRISGYDGDESVDEAVTRACMEVANDTPLGAWGVYYISSNVSRIIAYYDAQITITYKKTALEIAHVGSIHSAAGLEGELRYLLDTYSTGEAVYIPATLTDGWDLSTLVQNLYYADPSLAAVCPQITAAVYPEVGAEHIAEFTITWPYTAARLEDMEEKVNDAVLELCASVAAQSEVDGLYQLCWVLADTVEQDTEWEKSGSTDFSRLGTAFGALIDGKADSEGFALAVSLLCDKLGLDSMVVRGRKDSVDHCWNLIELNGKWYHVDASAFSRDGDPVFLAIDEDMISSYWWDTTKYPAADERSQLELPAYPEG